MSYKSLFASALLLFVLAVGVASFFAVTSFAPTTIQQGPTQFYAHFRSTNGSLVHVVSTDTTKTWDIHPVISESTAPTTELAKPGPTYAAVNGGYFNLSDGKSASYVVINSDTVADPTTNPALVNNPKLKPHLEKIFNRSEFRVLRDNNFEPKYTICPHNEPIPEGFGIDSSLQAGPQLLPTVTDEEEAFVRKDADGNTVDSIGARRNAARTAVGIRPDGTVVFVAVAGKPQDSSSPGMTLRDLSALMKQLGCVQALNLDGGNSTTMFVYPKSDSYGVTVCGKKPETHVKSVLLLVPRD